ncbi:uncharacterized protein LOC125509368 isoform X1 [Triticum urartu]|uniref:Uncharacterized protein n=1 Tax=Triticum urartu TaxID=4572 RepID=A0A8R7QFV7_TRIUA|nr:uncharacterized protein LOC125509368 isoform X1 [Triticum urartu]
MGEQRGEEREAMGEEEDGPLVLAVSSSLDLCQPAASNVMDSLCDAGVPCSCRRCARSDGARSSRQFVARSVPACCVFIQGCTGWPMRGKGYYSLVGFMWCPIFLNSWIIAKRELTRPAWESRPALASRPFLSLPPRLSPCLLVAPVVFDGAPRCAIHHLLISLATSVPMAFVLVGGMVQGATPTWFLTGWMAFRRNPGAL